MQALVEHRFNPYTDNGGTVLSIAGEDYCIAAGDTRQSEGYSIHTRYSPKVFKLRENILFCSSGFKGDISTLKILLEGKLETYCNIHEVPLAPSSFAQMLSTVLYSRRFFPYFTWNILGTLDPNGKGVVYSYDPVGNFEPVQWSCAGSGSELVQPFLDNQLGKPHQKLCDRSKKVSLEEALKITKDAFSAAAESDIYTGDLVEIFTITSSSINKEQFSIRSD